MDLCLNIAQQWPLVVSYVNKPQEGFVAQLEYWLHFKRNSELYPDRKHNRVVCSEIEKF